MWRADDWDKQLKELYGNWEYAFPSTRQAFEAGASAMLKALKAGGEYRPMLTIRHIKVGDENHEIKQPAGWEIFIPDEEGK